MTTIAQRLGVNKSTVCYHARALGIHAERKFAKRYDWDEVQSYYDACGSVRQTVAHFSMSKQTWHEARRRGVLVAVTSVMPLDTLLVRGRRTSRNHLKRRLIGSGIKKSACETCGIDSWRGQPLSMSLHHVNGDGLDNRLENLRMLCPNCHAQTPNFSGKNRGRPLRAIGATPLRDVRMRRLPLRGEAA